MVGPASISLRRQTSGKAAISKRPGKGEGAGNVVVGHDEMVRAQRHVAPLVHIEIDRTELLHDPLMGPALEGTSQIDADQFPEHTGIDTFGIILGYGRHAFAPLDPLIKSHPKTVKDQGSF